MKKGILVLLVLAMLVASTGIVGHAREINDTTTGDISLDIRIGFDPTDPNPPEPPTNPDNWIAVTVPDRIALVSNGSATPSHTELLEVAHRVENRSVHAVTVSVDDFNLDASLVGNHFHTLELIAGATTVSLIDAHTLLNLPRTPMFTLNGTYENGLGNVEGVTVESNFNFTGTLIPSTTGTVVNETDGGSITLHFSSHGPTVFTVPTNPHERFEDPDTGTVWRVLVPAADPRGGIGNALIITEYVHRATTTANNNTMNGNTPIFTVFEDSLLRKSPEWGVLGWYNSPTEVGPTLRARAFNYEFGNLNMTGDAFANGDRAALGAGIEDNTATGQQTPMINAYIFDAIIANPALVNQAFARPVLGTLGDGEPFLLSVTELREYFGGETHNENASVRIAVDVDTAVDRHWLLRSPGSIPAGVSNPIRGVDSNGNLQSGGQAAGNLSGLRGLRPALWVRG